MIIDAKDLIVGRLGTFVAKQALLGEKIDIIRWSDDPEEYVSNALSPAKLKQVNLNPAKGECEVIVDEDQLSLAIGKKGQNVRLSSRLTGWKIDIFREGEVLKGVKGAVAVLGELPGVGEKMARNLVEAGFTDLSIIAISEPEDLMQVEGVGQKTAEELIKAAQDRTE